MLHMQLHAAKCPFIMGALCIITDLWTDVLSVLILMRWIPSDQKKVWTPQNVSGTFFHLVSSFEFISTFSINAKNIWIRNSIGSLGVKDRIQKIIDSSQGISEPSILAIMASARQETGFAVRMRAAIVCRGLPVYNILAEIAQKSNK